LGRTPTGRHHSSGAGAVVEALDDRRQQFVLRFGDTTGAAEFDRGTALRLDEHLQSLAAQVVAFELGVANVTIPGEERVDADVLAQSVGGRGKAFPRERFGSLTDA
jgi:hypothetical protein